MQQSSKGSTIEQILDAYKAETNPVTRSVYRDIIISRLKRDQKERNLV